MESSVKKAWLALLVFPAVQYGVFVLIAYIDVYWFENYDRKFDKAAAFEFQRYLIAFYTAITSVLYSITFLLNAHSIWNQIRTFSWITITLPIAVCALIHVGLFFPFAKLGSGFGLIFWLLLIPPAFAWLSVKYLSEEQQLETS